MSRMNYKEIHKKYTPLVIKHVSKYPKELWDDLKQESYIALYEAYKAWDPKRSKFITFAYKYIHLACYKYMRDKVSTIRIPAKPFREGVSVPCESLDAKISDKSTLEDLFGIDSEEDYMDTVMFVWKMLKKLVDKHVITLKSFAFLYYRYFREYKYSTIGSHFGISGQSVGKHVGRTLVRIRPYFLERKRI